MSRSITCTAALAMLVLAASASAERALEDRSKATHVVLGKVEGVYARDERDTRYYVVEIAVEKVEKGDNVKPGEMFYVRCYLRIPDHYKNTKLSEKEQERIALRGPGYDGVPKEGERVRVYARSGEGKYDGIYPDWYDVVKNK
ncbi:MAG TPA: hypothetical protein VGG61_03815 [Gemmataceae bacterium]|jgi:hypothetical protein